MPDTSEEKARRAKLLEEIRQLSEEAGLYEDEATPEEIVASVKQVRKEMAEERQSLSYRLITGGMIDAFKAWGYDESEIYRLVDLVREAEQERIIKAFYAKRRQLEQLVILAEANGSTDGKWFYEDRIKELDRYIALIKGEQK